MTLASNHPLHSSNSFFENEVVEKAEKTERMERTVKAEKKISAGEYRKHKTAVMGVVYPGVEAYLEDYLSSMCKQTDQNFDLVLFNDRFPGLSSFLNSFFSQYSQSSLPVVVMDMPGGTISTKRCWALRKIQALGYDNVIFTDCDDFFSPERVHASVQALTTSGIAFNDFVQVNESKQELFRSIFQGRGISAESKKDIHRLNFLGFSNTAVRISEVQVPEFAPDLVAVDWFFFSVLIMGQGVSLSYIPKPLSFYRSYGNNFGFRDTVTPEYLKRVSEVKNTHYHALLGQRKGVLPDSFLENVRQSFGDMNKTIADQGKTEEELFFQLAESINQRKNREQQFNQHTSSQHIIDNQTNNNQTNNNQTFNQQEAGLFLWWEALV